jgi:hypothetical protein
MDNHRSAGGGHDQARQPQQPARQAHITTLARRQAANSSVKNKSREKDGQVIIEKNPGVGEGKQQ